MSATKIDNRLLVYNFFEMLRSDRTSLNAIKARIKNIKEIIRANKKKIPEGVDPETWKIFLADWDSFQKEYSNFQF